MVADSIDKITWHHDEPLGDAATINNYFLAKEAKKWVTVVLAGEGGDELFGGYPWHRWSKYTRIMMWIPKWTKTLGQDAIWTVNRGDPTTRTHALSRMALFPCQPTAEETLLYPTTAMSRQNVEWLLNNDTIPSLFFQKKERYSDGCRVASSIRDQYNKTLAIDYLNLLPEKFLMKADKGTMAWGVEERLPLLDQEIVKLAFGMSAKVKRDKWVLRKSVEDLLPLGITWRPKQGFGTPVAEWLGSTEIRDRVNESLSHGSLLCDIMRPEARTRILEAISLTREVHRNGRRKTATPTALSLENIIWGLFALQVWHDVWFRDSMIKGVVNV